MKAVFAILVVALVLAAPDWTEIENRFKEICDHLMEAADKMKEIANSDADKDAAKCIGDIVDKCLQKMKTFYLENIKPCIDDKTLTPEKALNYCRQMQKMKDESKAEMKPQLDKLSPENVKKMDEICGAADKFRVEKVKKIVQRLKS